MDRMVVGWNWTSETSGCAFKGEAVANTPHELLWKCRLKPALTGSCRPLSLMHCFLTRWFLRQIICLKKSLNYLELQKIVVLFRCSIVTLLPHSPPSLLTPSPCLFPSAFLSLPAFLSFSLLPPSLHLFCPQALAADCVVWRFNEAVLIQ